MVLYYYHLTHNLKVVGSNPTPATKKILPTLDGTLPPAVGALAYASMLANAPCKTTSLLPRCPVGATAIVSISERMISVA